MKLVKEIVYDDLTLFYKNIKGFFSNLESFLKSNKKIIERYDEN